MMRDNLNNKGFGIMDVGANHVKAGAAFEFGGFIISMSTVFNAPDVAVFRNDADAEIEYKAESVEDAIEWVTKYQKRQIDLDTY